MKKVLIMGLVAIALVLGVSCTTTDNWETDETGTPLWTAETPVSDKAFYGVGSSSLISEKNQSAQAVTAANEDLSKSLEDILMKFASSLTNAEGHVENTYERNFQQSPTLPLLNVKNVAEWKAEDGTLHTMISISTKDLVSSIKADAASYRTKLAEKIVALEKEKIDVLSDLETIAGILEGGKAKLDNGEELTATEKEAAGLLQYIMLMIGYDGKLPLPQAVELAYNTFIQNVQIDREYILPEVIAAKLEKVLKENGYEIK